MPRGAGGDHDGAARALAIALVLLAAGVATVSLLGPLALGVISYHVGADVENQVVGGDAVALALVAPVAVVAAGLTLRGRPAGPVLALAPTAFAAYLYTQLAVGGDFASAPGNSQRFFPLFLMVFLLAVAGLVLAWRATARWEPPEPGRRLRRAATAVLLAVAAFLTFGLHLRGLVDVVGGPPYGVEYTQSPAVFWVVKWMDLGLVVPLTVVTAVGLLRRADWATRLMYAVIGWGALLGCAVAAMGLVMVLRDDPAATLGGTVVFVALAASFVVLDALLLRAGTRDRPPDRPARGRNDGTTTGPSRSRTPAAPL